MMKITQKFLAFIAIAAITISCCTNAPSGSVNGTTFPEAKAKYIFYFIGDGMAATQVQLASAALTASQFRENFAKQTGSQEQIEQLNLKSLSITGLATSSSANRYITDSAAAGTALATGSKTNSGVIGLDPDGNTLQSVAEMAKQSGMKVGIISSVSIDHATPASFYAHVDSRSEYTKISDQLLTSGFDYFAGGSVKWNSRAKSEGTDNATAYTAYRQRAQEAGFKFATNKQEFDALQAGEDQAIIATLKLLTEEMYTGDGSSMPYTIDLDRQSCEDNKISLAQFTQKGIDLLEGEKGFFMMIEGGKIDWACHANDAATAAYETVAFDQAIGVAMAFAANHPSETLIVVTGDHDCGGLTIGFAGTYYESAFEVLAGSTISVRTFMEEATNLMKAGESFDSLLKYACENLNLTNNVKSEPDKAIAMSSELTDYEIKSLRSAYAKSLNKLKSGTFDAEDKFNGSFGGYDPFTVACLRMLNNKSGIDFSSYSHTAIPVMVYADGASANIFSGYYDNTDIPKKIMQAAGLK
ncbi:MAG: alkaline phosphatase [Rikenellaceae bacterium]